MAIKTVEIIESALPSLGYELFYRGVLYSTWPHSCYSLTDCKLIALDHGFTHYKFNGVNSHYGRRIIKGV